MEVDNDNAEGTTEERYERNNGPQGVSNGMPMLNVYDAMLLVPSPERASKAQLTNEDHTTFMPCVHVTSWLWNNSQYLGDRVYPPYLGLSYENWRLIGMAQEGQDRVDAHRQSRTSST